MLSYSFGATNPGSSGGGTGQGRPIPEDFVFTHAVDKASPVLFQACCNGTHLKRARLSVRRTEGPDDFDFCKVRLEELLVSSWNQGFHKVREDEIPIDEVSISFQKIEISETAPDGTVITASFDFSQIR